MVEVYTSEQEQVEALKKWWKENGKSIIFGLVLGLGAVFGWRLWSEYQAGRAEAASDAYAQLLAALDAGEQAQVASLGAQLTGSYGDTPYATMAALVLARAAAEQQQLDAAAQQLRWALEHADEDATRHVARLRLARVMLAQGEGEAALKLLEGVQAESFQAAYDAVRGDALVALGRPDEARSAYAAALAALPPNADNRDFLQMKLDELAAPEDQEAAQ